MTDDHPSIELAKAEAIARGDDTFDTTPLHFDTPCVAQVNRLLRIGFWIMAGSLLVALVTLGVVVAFRAVERRNADTNLVAVTSTLAAAEQRIVQLNSQVAQLTTQVDETQTELRCRASSQAEVDRAQLDVLVTIGDQFASALDRVEPPPDPAVLESVAAAGRAALDARDQTIQACAANPTPDN